MTYKYRPPYARPKNLYPNARRRPMRPKRDPSLPITYTNKPIEWHSIDRYQLLSKPLSGGAYQVLSDVTSQVSLPVVYENKTGYVVPAYQELIRNQKDASEVNYQREWYTAEAETGSMSYMFKDLSLNVIRTYFRDGQLVVPDNWPTLTSLYSATLDAQAQSEFLQKLYNKQTTFNGGKFLVELKQTIHGITHPLQGIYTGMFDYIKTLKARAYNRRYVKRLPRYGTRVSVLNRLVANTWLEFQFGWKPLLNDIDDAMLALSYLTQRSPTEHLSAKAKSVQVLDGAEKGVSCGYWTVWYKLQTKNTTTVKYTGGMKAYLDDAVSGLSKKSLGVSLSDVIPSIWEVLPYSFLVDYFVNVGQVIEGSMASTAALYYCTKSVHVRNTITGTAFRYVDGLGNEGRSGSVYRLFAMCSDVGNVVLSHESIQRTKVIPGSLAATLRLQYPKLGSLRWANMAALIAQGSKVQNILTNLGRS